MSEFFKKDEELTNQSNDSIEQEAPKYKDEFEGFDTIFSDPEQKRAAAGNTGNKKRWTVILSSLLAVLVLVAGTLGIIKFIPKSDKNENSPSSNGISVLSLDINLLNKVTVKNENGKFVFLSERKKLEDDEKVEGSEEEYKTVWSLEGFKAEIFDSYLISGTFEEIGAISATREVTELSLVECGLENPKFTVDIESEKYGNFSLLIGSESLDKMGSYLKLSNKDTIYLVTTTLNETLNFNAVDLADVTNIDVIDVEGLDEYLTDSAITSFEKLTVSGEGFKKPLVIGMNKDDFTAPFMPYVISSPVTRPADNLTSILSVFRNSVAADSAYALDTSAATLKKFNLDKPYIKIKLEIGGQTLEYKFAKVDENNCAMISSNSSIVKKVPFENIEFLEFKEKDLYSRWVMLRAIDDIENITFTLNGKSHKFEISYDHGENKDDSSDDVLQVYYKGKKINADSFKSFYEILVALQAKSFDTVKNDSPADLTIDVNYLKKYKRNESYTFKRASATSYQYSLDGKDYGAISATSYNKLIKALENLVG